MHYLYIVAIFIAVVGTWCDIKRTAQYKRASDFFCAMLPFAYFPDRQRQSNKDRLTKALEAMITHQDPLAHKAWNLYFGYSAIEDYKNKIRELRSFNTEMNDKYL